MGEALYWHLTQLRKELLAKSPNHPALKIFYSDSYSERDAYLKAIMEELNNSKQFEDDSNVPELEAEKRIIEKK